MFSFGQFCFRFVLMFSAIKHDDKKVVIHLSMSAHGCHVPNCLTVYKTLFVYAKVHEPAMGAGVAM